MKQIKSSAAAAIRDCIKYMRVGQIFTSRDMLRHGTRAAVDNELSKLNAKKTITRVAFGVYVKGSPKAPMPSIITIARTKSDGFRRQIAPIDVRLAEDLNFTKTKDTPERLFATSGRTSKIWTIHGYIYFVGTSLRKIQLSESKVGTQLRTVWHLGRDQDLIPVVRILKDWNDRCWREAESRSRELPQWLYQNVLRLPHAGASQFRTA